jgi:hypothetical protein
MKTSKINAAIVGLLFIIATVSGTIAATIGNPIVDAPDYLTKISANEGAIIIGTFLVFLMAVSCAGIGVGLYPIMRNYSAGMAIGTVGFRVIESMGDILGGISTIALLALSQEFVKAGAPDAAYFETIGAVIKAGDEWLSNGVMLLSWCIGAFMYYGVFYRYRLVPHWLSGWGLVGITLTTITSVLVMLHIIPGFGTVQIAANLPIALQEMVFAIWLIAKGVNSTANVAGPVEPGVN